jgi:hypothetical protein
MKASVGGSRSRPTTAVASPPAASRGQHQPRPESSSPAQHRLTGSAGGRSQTTMITLPLHPFLQTLPADPPHPNQLKPSPPTPISSFSQEYVHWHMVTHRSIRPSSTTPGTDAYRQSAENLPILADARTPHASQADRYQPFLEAASCASSPSNSLHLRHTPARQPRGTGFPWGRSMRVMVGRTLEGLGGR